VTAGFDGSDVSSIPDKLMPPPAFYARCLAMTISPTATDAPEAFGVSLPDDEPRRNLERARQYLAAIEASHSPDGPASGEPFAFLASDIQQIEYPNQFVPKGASRDLAAMREAGERGRRVIRSERYEVRTALAHGNEVALEVLWTGKIAVAVGSLAAGDEMRAHFGVFLTLRDGLIVSQRNYDCFEPF
jgi:ketosteroid isomerase-like protein